MADATLAYECEWDPTKANANRRKHRVSFEEAATVFLDPQALSLYDAKHSDAEDRWVTLGLASTGRLLVVCHTFRAVSRQRATVRIFSSRKATRKEVQSYGG
jgi:uncharacterized DUF497 family protein